MIGVGKLGQDCAEVMAQYYDVVGYDVEERNPAFIMHDTIQEAVTDRDIIFIAAPTPHDPMYGGETPTSHLPVKDFDYTIVSDILDEVNKYVNQSQLVVLISTVLPGTVRNILRPKITNARFIYNPYLIAMGTVKWDMVNPEMLIIGTEDGSTTGDAKELIDFYQPMMQNNPRIEVGTWDEAEAIKIFYNTFISTKLGLVNMIQDVAERNGNMNVDVVTNALANSTYRIMGPAYMKAGLGDAGACHPRDNIALRYMAERLDLGYDLFDSIMRAREVQAENLALRCLRNGNNVTIIGKAYKPGVPYCNGSASMLVGHYIEKHGGIVNYYDIHTGDLDLKEYWTDVYLIGYWEEYVEKLAYLPVHATIIDPWRKHTRPNSIHYGDTRRKIEYLQQDDYQNKTKEQVLRVWPELEPHMDKSHFIYSSYNTQYALYTYPAEVIVDAMREAYNKGKRYFFFDCLAEPMKYYNMHRIHTIVKLAKKEFVDAKYFFLSGCLDAEEKYEEMITKPGWDRQLTVFSCHFFESGTSKRLSEFTTNEYDVERTRNKKYVNLNRVPRTHRFELMEKLLENDLVDQGYVSFGMDGGWITRTLPGIQQVQYKYPKFIENLHRFPMDINIANTRPNPADIWLEDVQYFDDSYFSVVTETVYYGDNIQCPFSSTTMYNIFPSEKIYKPIALLHPFILVSRPYFLAKLREHGYKTFAPFIDETYDTIEDDAERMQAIANEINRLCQFTDTEWSEWMKNIKPIVEYNKQYWYNLTDYRVTRNVLDYFG